MIIGGLFVLALTAVLVGPYFVDWSSYRADFEREASAILGRKVTVHGEATATILPFPSVTFSDVAVGGGPGGEPAMTAETFSMDAELAPLLSGDFHIFDMRLVRPKATIEVADDGKIDWTMRPSAPFDAGQISIEKLTVTEGQITVIHAASGRTHKMTEINSEISAKSLAGPWRMVGSMRLDGQRSAITVNTGRGSSGAMRLRIQAEPEVQKVSIESDGELSFEAGGAAKYAGDFRLAARRDEAQASAPAQGPGFRVKGKFALDAERLAFDPFLFETGPLDNPYSAEGKGFVDFGSQPHFAMSLDGAQMRFDEAIGAGGEAGGLTLSQSARRAAGNPARPAQAFDAWHRRSQSSGRGGRRHHDPRRAPVGRTGERRLDGQVARRDAAGPNDARSRRHAEDRGRTRVFRVAAAGDRPAIGVRGLGGAGRRRGDPAPACGRLSRRRGSDRATRRRSAIWNSGSAMQPFAARPSGGSPRTRSPRLYSSCRAARSTSMG